MHRLTPNELSARPKPAIHLPKAHGLPRSTCRKHGAKAPSWGESDACTRRSVCPRILHFGFPTSTHPPRYPIRTFGWRSEDGPDSLSPAHSATAAPGALSTLFRTVTKDARVGLALRKNWLKVKNYRALRSVRLENSKSLLDERRRNSVYAKRAQRPDRQPG